MILLRPLVLLAMGLILSVACQQKTSLIKSSHTKTEAEKKLSSDFQAKVIYGEDNRLDLYQVENPALLQLAHSTVALIDNYKLSLPTEGRVQISTSHYGQSYNLCPEEPFREQQTAAFCSGFLVAPDVVVTAGHCINSQSKCNSTSFVFGFGMNSEGASVSSVPSEDVYRCNRLIRNEVVGGARDYAVVQLDRPVPNYKPLRVRKSGEPEVGTALVVIGHPAGLPTKVADGAIIRSIRSEHFVTTLDTYGGNSGSAVFNIDTGEVEGILVRGEADFVSRGGCRISNVCGETECRGEDVTKISQALPYIPQE